MILVTRLRNYRSFFAVALTACLVCSLAYAQSDAATNQSTTKINVLVERAATHHGLPLQTGQMVVTSGAKADDLFLLLFEQQFHPFSHIGLVAVEDGVAYVYDAQGTVNSTTKDSIGIGGGLRRKRFDDFLKESEYLAVYDLPSGVSATKVLGYAREQFLNKTPYDGVFDGSDASAVYCSEYVERALLAGGAQPSAKVAFTRNASVRTLLEVLGVKATTVVSVGELVSRSQRVAVVSKERSFAQMALDMAIVEELWRRFTADQKLGALFERTFSGIDYSGDVKLFVEKAQALPLTSSGKNNELTAEQANSRVQALALSMFGSYAKP